MSQAKMTTTEGEIVFELFDEDAPKTVSNFKQLAGQGFYDGLLFHRVIKDFMIQGGCPQGTGTGGPGYTFEDEINDHKIVRGALAMANAGPDTNGSQFFIVTTDAAPWLDGKHTVFGEVTSGMDVVDRLEGLPTDAHDRPQEPAGIATVHRGVGSLDTLSSRSEQERSMAVVEQQVESSTTGVPVQNPATGAVIAHVPDMTPEEIKEMARRGRARAARLGGARLRGPRPRAAARAEVAARQRRPRDRHDHLGDRQDLRGRAARRDLLRRRRRSASGPRTPRATSPTRRSSRPTCFVKGKKLDAALPAARPHRRHRALELPADELVRRLHPGARRRQRGDPQAVAR